MNTQTISADLDSLPSDIKLMRLKTKLISVFIDHDRELNYLLENIDDESARRLIDRYYANIEHVFADYRD